GGLPTRRLEGALQDDLVASFSDRSAFLIVSSVGSGSLALLNADLMQSNLPSSSAFVPMLGELTNILLGRGRGSEPYPCGEALSVLLPPNAGPAAGLTTSFPGQNKMTSDELREEGAGVLWLLPTLPQPGVYQVKRQQQTVYAVAAAIPAEEADLRTLDPAVFR